MSTMTCPTKKKQKKVHRLPGKHSRGASLLMAEYYQQLAANNDDDKVVNKSTLVKKYGIPITTVQKRIKQIVKGKGHYSGSARKP